MGPPFSYERGQEAYFPANGTGTQWPFDPADATAFDDFLAGYGPLPADLAASEDMDANRLARLLDRIGPAILLTHSASGPDGWLAADRRPGLVKAIVTVEPIGPPFAATPGIGSLDWGLTAVPISTILRSPAWKKLRRLIQLRAAFRRWRAYRWRWLPGNLRVRAVRPGHRGLPCPCRRSRWALAPARPRYPRQRA